MANERPNVILLTTDQQRGDCISIDEQAPECLQTPHLDALARSGVRFRRGYSECPSCFPARRTLMSGMAPAAQGMVGMSSCDFDPPATLAGEFARAGYHSYLVGKLHLQPSGALHGFHHQVLADNAWSYSDSSAYSRWLQRTRRRDEVDAGSAHGMDPNGWDARPHHLPETQMHTYWCISEALDFLRYHRDPSKPFFLNVSTIDPHPPLTPPQFYWDRYIQRQTPAPVRGDWVPQWSGPDAGQSIAAHRVHLDEQQSHCTRAGYYGMINFVDDQVGRLVQYLRRNGLSNTYLLFTSDHGEMLGDHDMFRKCWAYEGSARVPYFVTHLKSMPGAAGAVVDQPVGLQDVMPTLLDLAGIDVPESCTGKSLAPLLAGEEATVRDVLHGEHSGQYDNEDGMHYLVGNRYKYIWYSQHGTEQLFDLHEDPMELRDMARQPDAEAKLAPWRQRLVEVLQGRPEGFVQEGRLKAGVPHKTRVPGHEPGQYTAFL